MVGKVGHTRPCAVSELSLNKWGFFGRVIL